MKKIYLNNNVQKEVEDFLVCHSDKSIQEVYDFIKKIKVSKRSRAQHLVYSYLFLNKRKLGIK